MIYRNKQPAAPTGLLSTECLREKNDALRSKANHVIKEKYYRDATIDSLQKIYQDKCAYCERRRGTELQVDHFRPKKPRAKVKNPHYNQPGYYWLCYEWTNLIPLCSKCNQKKSNKFPLTGWVETNRIIDHTNTRNLVVFLPNLAGWLNTFEQPLLIHPEFELNPARHFRFDTKCKMIGRTPEGIETIELCALNRKDLLRKRSKRVGKYVKMIMSALDDFSNHNNEDRFKGELTGVFKDIFNRCRESETFSLFNTFVYKYFDEFIAEKLPVLFQSKISRYFQDFKNGRF